MLSSIAESRHKESCVYAYKRYNLIELMIVVAIIGILAAIAVPQYQAYVNRAKMTEAFMVFARLKNDVTEFHTRHRRLPLNSELSGFATLGRQSPYVVAIEINNVPGTDYNERNNPAIRIFVKMDPKQFAGMNYQSNQMMFTADTRGLNGGIAWSCGPGDRSAVKRAWLPSTCRD
ncbi:MAG: pilin [Thiocapsa sp.]|uniref:pilin n=1 Tax=Thiocapsa sp. TaxID=2024551 RepID=UPI001BCF4EAE|nr:pilin [Thiocapsa sp.]QVL49822.1 MAG: pilin [Thiocapsa sp.]